jgi:hypothetical protein
VTPPAATVAARRRATGTRAARPSRVAGGARPTRPARPGRAAGARPARRVSGPARPIARAAAAAAAVALPQPVTRPSAPPRRRPAAVPRPSRRAELPRGARALAWLRALPDHRLLDRLIGGRIWIVLLGTLLVGIVTMQLTLLRLNAGIGRAVERGGTLEQRNAGLRLSISRLSDSRRIVALATQAGFVMPPQGSPRFLTASADDAPAALRTMRVPDPALMAAATAAPTDATATTTTDPTGTTTVDPTADPAATSEPATMTPPVAATTPPATTPATTAGTSVPAATAAPVAGGGAAAPVQGQQ